ncbi:MAG: phosphoribosylformylglycinamidine cyclo-ligase [Chloroflexi bacterium]|nr:phosphoribosylformylglycinamidine cyclo-ligase [Chloroflexota bacterium]
MTGKSYLASGVDLNAAACAKELFKPHVRSTFGPQVLSDIGSFGGLFHLQGYRDPVLVSSTDNVGTKLKLAVWLDRFDTIGHDVVNQSVNDIITNGARPLFFLDYIAVDTLVPRQAEAIVKGIAEACRQVGCALIGGETAQMPGVYTSNAMDLAGFIVGAVERDALLDSSTIQEGDTLLALPSSGLHTNGYSLVRQALGLERDPSPLHTHHPELGRTLGDALLEPHRCYWPLLEPVLPLLKGMAHITGGGLMENLKRVLPQGLEARIDHGSWDVPPLFHTIQQRGDIADDEMWRVFNMGIGMVLACAPDRADEVRRSLPEAWVVGETIDAPTSS